MSLPHTECSERVSVGFVGQVPGTLCGEFVTVESLGSALLIRCGWLLFFAGEFAGGFWTDRESGLLGLLCSGVQACVACVSA